MFKENSFSDSLKSCLIDFIEMRKAIKKPMTVKALELLIRNLKKLTNLEEEQIAILNQSIEHSWQSVYPLKNKTNGYAKQGGMNDFKELYEEAIKHDENRNDTSYNLDGW